MQAAPIRIYLATGNAHKAEEIGTMLANLGAPCQVLSAKAIGGMPEVDENADSFEGNALLKAQALLTQLQSAQQANAFPSANAHDNTCAKASANALSGTTDPMLPTAQPPVCYVLADDSGLAVAALGGAPGIFSARYAGAGATDAANNALLLKNLDGLSPEQRGAAFVCCFALLGTDGSQNIFHGRCEGRIAHAEAGAGGFGYDPLFIPEGHTQSFSELGPTIKNTISHRTHCCQALAMKLRQLHP